MKKIAVIIMCAFLFAALFYFTSKPSAPTDLKVGIILPAQHIALDDIALGFKSDLEKAMPTRTIKVEVQNALGDINLQKSIINKFINDKVDLLVPVGKGASLMSLNLAPSEQTILFLAAFIKSDSEEAKKKPGLMGVIDEISVDLQLSFMQKALPKLEKIAVIYVSSDKIFDDVKEFATKAESLGIKVQQLMVQNVSELYTVSSRIESDNQAIFILKDVLVASGINALVQQANALKIPLITSDEGTIKKGGAFAVGVVEADIGRQGAKIATEFFDKAQGKESIQYLNKISVFVNKSACAAQGIDLSAIKIAADSMKLAIIEG